MKMFALKIQREEKKKEKHAKLKNGCSQTSCNVKRLLCQMRLYCLRCKCFQQVPIF